jgi:site-specific DNA-methyltransferase (adenine-specific)
MAGEAEVALDIHFGDNLDVLRGFSDGSFDYREVHYSKVLLDGIFGRDSLVNEIVWAYSLGAEHSGKQPFDWGDLPSWWTITRKRWTSWSSGWRSPVPGCTTTRRQPNSKRS